MKEPGKFVERMARAVNLEGETLPGQTIVELAGECRVLIENHRGLAQYGTRCVAVRTRYGLLQICGEGLSISNMTRERLIVNGCISVIQLLRGGDYEHR